LRGAITRDISSDVMTMAWCHKEQSTTNHRREGKIEKYLMEEKER
jgi:hypothetical protein